MLIRIQNSQKNPREDFVFHADLVTEGYLTM
jgi:hypothetical protein